MIIPPSLEELLCCLRKSSIAYKTRMGLSPDQTFLKQFIKKNYSETPCHRKMKNIVVSELVKTGVLKSSISAEKRPFKDYRFRPDLTIKEGNKLTLVECHFHDGWSHDSVFGTHLYNNIDAAKERAKIIICVTKEYDSRKSVEKRHQKLLKKANEIWVLDLDNDCIERKISCNCAS